ncbi:MAG: hypothetical protein ABJC13_21175 [Acidobacteriota bacterium]
MNNAMRIFTPWILLAATGAFPSTGMAPPAVKPGDYQMPTSAEELPSREEFSRAPVAQIRPAASSKTSVELFNPSVDEWRLVSRSAKEEVILVDIPKNEAPTLLRKSVLATFSIGSGGALDAVVWEYMITAGLLHNDLSTTYLAVCVLDRGAPVGPCRIVPVADMSVQLYRRTEPEELWLYWTADSTEPERATKSDVRLLLRDQDADGFTDLVVWRRTCGVLSIAASSARRDGDPKSLTRTDGCGLDFALESDERLVMRFDPKQRSFSAPIRDEGLPAPDLDLWDWLPSVTHFQVQ